jgi:membrane protein YdbS with pleckstrin-like domain
MFSTERCGPRDYDRAGMSLMANPDPSPSVMGDSAPGAAPASMTVADGLEHRLDPRSIPMERLTGWIAVGVLGPGLFGALLINWAATDLSVPGLIVRGAAWLALVGPLAWRAHAWPAVRYRHTSYRLDDLGIEIREGVFFRVVVNVPRTRVQHTDVAQGPIERKYGLGTLVIYTAGTDHSRVSLSGLEHGRAMAIRQHLLPGGTSDAV